MTGSRVSSPAIELVLSLPRHIQHNDFRRNAPPQRQAARSDAARHIEPLPPLFDETVGPVPRRLGGGPNNPQAGKSDLAAVSVAGQHKVRACRQMRKPDGIVREHDGRPLSRETREQGKGFGPDRVGIRHSNDIDGVILKLHAVTRVVEHGNAIMLERIGHGALSIDVIVVAEDCETAERRFKPRQDGRDRARWHAAAAKRLHIHVIAAEQHEVGRERRSVVDNRVEARDIVEMRSGVKIRQKGDAQGMPPSWPAVDLEMKATNNVALCAANLREPPLPAKLVAKRRAYNRAGQATSPARAGNFSHILLHHLTID